MSKEENVKFPPEQLRLVLYYNANNDSRIYKQHFASENGMESSLPAAMMGQITYCFFSDPRLRYVSQLILPFTYLIGSQCMPFEKN